MVPYVAAPPIQQWLCGDTKIELLGLPGRRIPLPAAAASTGSWALTWSDYLAGAGGSSSGIELVPGCGVVMAVNHWPLAIETHNFNLPHADHDVANVSRADPRRYPRTDLAWFSPECTYWSVARGQKCDYDDEAAALEAEEDDSPLAKEARWRSRMLMRDVVRFARHHHYKAIVVENVPDILKWARFDRWIAEMRGEDYLHKVIVLNSAFAHALGLPAPQLRDRVYVVFWKKRYRTPNWNKWLRPQAWCPKCERIVAGVFTAKPGGRRPMRYGPRAQYTYRCPSSTCRGVDVQPYVLPAISAIDPTQPSQRIGDRKRPLAAKTRARIAAALLRYSRPVVVETAGHTYERRPGVRSRPVDWPLTTQHTTASKSLACPPMLVPAGGTWNDQGTPLTQPMGARLTRENDTVVVPPFVVPLEGRDGQRARSALEPLRGQTTRHQDGLLVVPLRNNGVARQAVEHPLMAVAAGGEHHALVMRNNTARGDAGQMCTPVTEPMRTLTGSGKQSLLAWRSLLYSYDTGLMRPLTQPLPAQTTIEGDALVGPAVNVDDCTLRMLLLHEVQEGMAMGMTVLGKQFVLLGTAKRDKIRMLGNAVTPSTARDLAACVMEAVTGDEIGTVDLAEALAAAYRPTLHDLMALGVA